VSHKAPDREQRDGACPESSQKTSSREVREPAFNRHIAQLLGQTQSAMA
jgi:hypothetical protein